MPQQKRLTIELCGLVLLPIASQANGSWHYMVMDLPLLTELTDWLA